MREKFESINVVFFPMRLKTSVVGIIALGNVDKTVEFNNEDIEALRAFEKELVLGYQSSKILEKVKNIEIIDSLTGLYSFGYLEERLEDEISRAIYYQRPCSFILIKVHGLETFIDHSRTPRTEYILKKLGRRLNEILPPVDRIGRSDDNEFGILLPEKNKREALHLAEQICSQVIETKFETEDNESVKINVGVSENPIDGSKAKELIHMARKYSEHAREIGFNTVSGG